MLITSETEYPWILRRKQFPVRFYYIITINKAQGQTLNMINVDLRSQPFSHGQFYVALLRVTDVSRLIVLLRPDAEGKTENIV